MMFRLSTLCLVSVVAAVAVGAGACCDDSEDPGPRLAPVDSGQALVAPAGDAGVAEERDLAQDLSAAPAPTPEAEPGGEPDDPVVDEEAVQADADRRAVFEKLLEVSAADGWAIDYAAVGDTSNLVIGLEPDVKGDVPTVKVGLIDGDAVRGATTDFAAFTGADAKVLAKFKGCTHWGHRAREVVLLSDDRQALLLRFWCNWDNGASRELVVFKLASPEATTLADLKTLWVGEGAGADPPSGDCQFIRDAQFAVETAELVRTVTTIAVVAPPPAPEAAAAAPEPKPEDPAVQEGAENPALNPKCKAPEPAVDRFALAL